jgi:hypothetical protein
MNTERERERLVWVNRWSYYGHGISDKSKINSMCGFSFPHITTIM